MKIYLIRHGETTGDIEGRYGGAYDDHLTEGGKLQAIDLGRKLKDKGISIIYHSPKIRAVETTHILEQILCVNTISILDLQERNAYGIISGMTKSEAQVQFPQEVEKINNSSMYHDVIDSEDYFSFKERVVSCFIDLLSNVKDETIAIVTHGGYIRCIVREILGCGEFAYLGDCSYIQNEKKDDTLTLIALENARLGE